MKHKGLGCQHATLQVLIETCPPIEQYQALNHCNPAMPEELKRIGDQAGNGWRKVFNVYAKFIFELAENIELTFDSWQQFRDQALLQAHGNQALYLTVESTQLRQYLYTYKGVTIIAGKGYAEKLGVAQHCHWLSPQFALDKEHKVIVCPYFDYRQLTNEKISQLCQLVKAIQPTYEATK